MEDHLARYVERVAHFWEAQGVPRIAGRILGYLMVCEPPYRSATELARELQVSKGSVSSMTRLLLASGSIEVLPRPGERATDFQLSPDSLEKKLLRRLEETVAFRAIADEGLDLLADAPAAQRERLTAIRDLYAFLEQELAGLMDRWRESRS